MHLWLEYHGSDAVWFSLHPVRWRAASPTVLPLVTGWEGCAPGSSTAEPLPLLPIVIRKCFVEHDFETV